MFQSDDCKRPSVPAVEEGKNSEARNRDSENVGQIGRFETSGVTSLGICDQRFHHGLDCSYKFDGNLRSSIVDADAVAIVTDAAVEGRMDNKINGHRRWLSSFS